jgi:hypothetical protein
MSRRNGRKLSSAGRLVLALIAVGGIVVAVLVANAWVDTTAFRERAYPIPKTECQKAESCDERALEIQAREAVTADAALDVALGQLVASIIGVIGVGYTVFYARQAWKESERSADAASEALEHTRADASEQADRFGKQLKVAADAAEAARISADASRAALDHARTQSVAEAKRIKEQLRLTDQTMQFTAETAYAMRDSVREAKRLALAMEGSADAARRSVDVAEEVARKQLRAYVHAEAMWMKWCPEGYPLIFARLRNSGRTPALNVRAMFRETGDTKRS